MATRYVNTNSTPGGDGTTNATSGANRAYASLAEFEATLSGTLTEPWTVHYSGTVVDGASGVTFSGFTPSATNYVDIVGDHPGGAWSDSHIRLVRTGGTIISVWVPYLRLRHLQLLMDTTDGGDQYGIGINSGGTYLAVDSCLIYCTGGTGGYRRSGILPDTSVTDMRVANCTFRGWLNTTNSRACQVSGVLYHNTFIDCAIGADQPSSDAGKAINNLFYNVTSVRMSGTWAAGSGYNATDSASLSYTVTGGATGDRLSQTFTFEDAGAGDYRLTSGDAGAQGYGVDLSGDATYPVTLDQTGTTRPDPPSIGAYEPTGGGGPGTYHESLSLAAAAALAPSGTLVMSATQALSASAALAPSAALVIGATVALAADAAITTPSQAALVGAVALPADATITPTSTAALVATLALQGTGGLGLTAQATLGASLVLPAEAALGVVSQATVDAALALVASGTLTPAGAVVAQAVLALGLEAGYVTSAQIVGAPETHHETLALAAAAGLELQATGLLGAVQAFAAAAGLTQDAATVIGRALALAVEADLTTAAQGVLRPTLALPVDATLTSQAQAQLVALLTLSAAAVLAQAAQLQGVITYDVLKVAAETLRAAAVTHETLRAARALDETLH